MPKKSVFCIAASRNQAEQIVEDLKDGGFSNDDVSVLFPEKGSIRDFAYEKYMKAPEAIAARSRPGGAVGGALGWLAGVGELGVPGAGSFVAAGPVLAALSAGVMGAKVGGIAGGLIGMGVPELEAKRYEGKVKTGNFLLSVHTENLDEIADAERIFEDARAEDICATGESVAQQEREHHHTHV
jgi:hypothetical protein